MGMDMPRIKRKFAPLLEEVVVASVVDADEVDSEVVAATCDAVFVEEDIEDTDVEKGIGVIVIVVAQQEEVDEAADKSVALLLLNDDGVGRDGGKADGTGIKPVVCPPLSIKAICPFADCGNIAVKANPDCP